MDAMWCDVQYVCCVVWKCYVGLAWCGLMMCGDVVPYHILLWSDVGSYDVV